MQWETMRLQKYLSQAGICSRRKAEEYIEKGLVTINGETASIGQSIQVGKDRVELKNDIVEDQKKLVYYKFNKPKGIETTCAQKWGKSIVDIIDIPTRVFPIGRLDKDSEGLILLTNDGRLANYLMHPRYEHQKEYIVDTLWPISDQQLEKMSEGVEILWGYTKKAAIERYASWKFSIILTEGKNRQIRRMTESVGTRVKKLKRVRIENIELWNLEVGEYKHLSRGELSRLLEITGIDFNSSLEAL
jgi:pseudouridine synthase